MLKMTTFYEHAEGDIFANFDKSGASDLPSRWHRGRIAMRLYNCSTSRLLALVRFLDELGEDAVAGAGVDEGDP